MTMDRFRDFQLKSRSLAIACLTVLGIIGAASLILAMSHEPWAHSDSAAYIISARNLAEGTGLGIDRPSGRFVPTTGHPPLYQSLIAAQLLLGIQPFSAARLINIFSFLGSFWALGLVLLRGTRLKVLAAISPALLLFHPAIFELFAGAITEPLFIFLSVAAIGTAAFGCWQPADHKRYWWFSILLAALAWLTRYSGVVTILAISAIWLLPKANNGWRIGLAIKTGLLSALPFLAWLAWLWIGVGAGGPRTLEISSNVADDLRLLRGSFVDSAWSWLPFPELIPELPYRPQLLILSLIAVFLFSVVVIKIVRWLRKDTGLREHRTPISFAVGGLTFGISYLSVITFTVLFTYPNPNLDSRILSPLLMSGILMLISLPLMIGRNAKPGRIVRLSFVMLFLLVLVGYIPQNIDNIRQLSEHGRGYTSDAWDNSQTMEAVSKLDPQFTLVSSDPTALLLLLDRPAYDIPLDASSPSLEDLKPILDMEPSAPIEALKSGQGYLIVFDSYYWDLHPMYGNQTEAVMKTLFAGLEIYGEYRDGTIFTNR